MLENIAINFAVELKINFAAMVWISCGLKIDKFSGDEGQFGANIGSVVVNCHSCELAKSFKQ